MQHSRPRPCSSSRRAALGEGPGQGLRDRGSTSWSGGTYWARKEGIEKLKAIQRESDMTRRRRHGGRCSAAAAAARGASARAEAGAAAGRGRAGRERPAAAARQEGAVGHQRAWPCPRARLAPQPELEKGPSAPRIFPRAHLLLFRGRGKSSGRQRSKRIEVRARTDSHRPKALSAPWRDRELWVGQVLHQHRHQHLPWVEGWGPGQSSRVTPLLTPRDQRRSPHIGLLELACLNMYLCK